MATRRRLRRLLSSISTTTIPASLLTPLARASLITTVRRIAALGRRRRLRMTVRTWRRALVTPTRLVVRRKGVRILRVVLRRARRERRVLLVAVLLLVVRRRLLVMVGGLVLVVSRRRVLLVLLGRRRGRVGFTFTKAAPAQDATERVLPARQLVQVPKEAADAATGTATVSG